MTDDPEFERQVDLISHCVLLHEADDIEGYTHIDPRTGKKYIECISCGIMMDTDDFHSGQECDFCHAMNKDD